MQSLRRLILVGTGSFVSASRFKGTADTASYINVVGSGITVNWNEDELQLSGSSNSLESSKVYITDSVPSTSLPTGSLWWDSSAGIMSVLYNDGESTQWVETNYGGTVTTGSYMEGANTNTSDSYSSTAKCNNIVTLTSAEYSNLSSKDENTFYIVI
jgi:hypothetical protein